MIIGDFFAKSPGRRKSIVAACEQSLRRLRTDYIDLYWMHFRDRFTPIEETMRALDDLVRAGKVRYIGISDTPAWKVAQAQTQASTIIGARRLDQLDQNLAALDLALTDAQLAALNKVSEPTLSFPAGFGPMATMFGQGGTTINGAPSQMWPLLPQRDDERY